MACLKDRLVQQLSAAKAVSNMVKVMSGFCSTTFSNNFFFEDVPGGRAANGYPANAGASGIPRRPLCRRVALPRWKKKVHFSIIRNKAIISTAGRWLLKLVKLQVWWFSGILQYGYLVCLRFIVNGKKTNWNAGIDCCDFLVENKQQHTTNPAKKSSYFDRYSVSALAKWGIQ